MKLSLLVRACIFYVYVCVVFVYVCMCLVISREKNPRDEVKCQDIADILKPAHFYKKAPAWSTTGRKRDGGMKGCFRNFRGLNRNPSFFFLNKCLLIKKA